MTYRFEEENYQNTYVLEDFYHTHPFYDYNYVVVRLRDQDNQNNAFAFQVNFNKTFNPLPDHPRLTDVQTQIAKGFAKGARKSYFPNMREVCVDQSVSTTGTSVRMVRDLD